MAGTARLALGLAALPAAAVPSDGAPASSEQVRAKPDNRTSPQIRKQARLKAKARAIVENGSAKARTLADGSQVVEVADGEFVELGETGTDKIWTILSEFGTQGSKKLGLTPGPLHNAIPKPDRTKDNSTTWEPSYDKAYYDDLFNGPGESMANFYTAQSNGASTASTSTTEDWVTVPGNASTYGDNAVEDDGGSWSFVNDTADAWADHRRGRSTAELERLPRRSSTCGTATTSTRTATSTRPTATSTTSRPSTPARARRPAPTPTPSGPTAGTPTRRPPAPRARPSTASPTSTAAPGSVSHELLHRRLHRRARERWPRRLRARVRPRPRPARLLRHQRRRQRHVVLDHHVLRLVARPRRRRRGHRHARPAASAPRRSSSSAG